MAEAEAGVRSRSKGKSGKTNVAMINSARQQVLDKMLKIDPLTARGRYRDPALNMKPKQKPGESSGQPDETQEVDVGVDFLG